MDISSRLSQFDRFALKKTIIGRDGDKGNQPAPENKEGENGGEGVYNAPTVEADALTLLAMQNKALINIDTVIQTKTDEGNDKGGNDTETPETNDEQPAPPPKVNAPAYAPAADGDNSLGLIDAIFGENDTIDAKEFYNCYLTKLSTYPLLTDEWSLYDLLNVTMKSFIDDTSDTNNLNTYCFFDALISRINDTVGEPNTEPHILTKKAISKLNQDDLIQNMADIIYSEEFEKEFYVGTIDGVIDVNAQGHSGGGGDCWLISAINMLKNSPIGSEILSHAIKVDKEKDEYTVVFAALDENGNNRSYTFSYEDIKNAATTIGYASGDKDVLLLEIATQALFKEVEAGTFVDHNGILTDTDINGGLEEYFFYALTGNKINMHFNEQNGPYEPELYAMLEKASEDLKNGTTAVGCQFMNPHSAPLQGVTIVDGHAYTITDIYIAEPNDPEHNTVTIVNPWNSTVAATITWKEFAEQEPSVTEYEFEQLSAESLQRRELITYEKYMDYYQNKQLEQFNLVFDQFENGEIGIVKAYQTIQAISNSINLSEEQHDVIFNKWLLVVSEQSESVFTDNDTKHYFRYPCDTSGTCQGVYNWGTMQYDYTQREYKYNGSTYVVTSAKQDGLKSYNLENIYAYTDNTNIINQFFDVAVTKDGEPYIYRLKEGVTFEDFKNATKGKTIISGGNRPDMGLTVASFKNDISLAKGMLNKASIKDDSLAFKNSSLYKK